MTRLHPRPSSRSRRPKQEGQFLYIPSFAEVVRRRRRRGPGGAGPAPTPRPSHPGPRLKMDLPTPSVTGFASVSLSSARELEDA